MMNAQDALGLQEDLARIRNAAARPTMHDHLPVPDESGNAIAAAVMTLKARANSQQRLRDQLESVGSERNEVAVLAKAARDTLALLARELARYTGTTEEEGIRIANELLSRRFDALLDSAIANRQVLRDVRADPAEMQQRRWYIAAP